ncbi:hypothetical protein Tco_0525118 [Tanacetum coccineum]
MTGVPRNIAEHRLNIREGYSPVRQKKRGQAPERNKAIQEEVEKLVDAGIMKEVHYHSWLSNPERITKKRTKNEAKSTKPDSEWKSKEKTKSKSKTKPEKVNPSQSPTNPKVNM